MAFIFRFRERTTAGVTCLRSYYTFHLQLWSYTVITLNFYYKPVKSLIDCTVLVRIFKKKSRIWEISTSKPFLLPIALILLSSRRIDWTVEDILVGTATRWRSRQSSDSSSSSISSKEHVTVLLPHRDYSREKLQLHWSGQIGSSLHVWRVDWNDWPWLQYKSFGSTSFIFVSWMGIRLRLEEWRFWPPVHFMNGASEAFRFRKWAFFGQKIRLETYDSYGMTHINDSYDMLWPIPRYLMRQSQ